MAQATTGPEDPPKTRPGRTKQLPPDSLKRGDFLSGVSVALTGSAPPGGEVAVNAVAMGTSARQVATRGHDGAHGRPGR